MTVGCLQLQLPCRTPLILRCLLLVWQVHYGMAGLGKRTNSWRSTATLCRGWSRLVNLQL